MFCSFGLVLCFSFQVSQSKSMFIKRTWKQNLWMNIIAQVKRGFDDLKLMPSTWPSLVNCIRMQNPKSILFCVARMRDLCVKHHCISQMSGLWALVAVFVLWPTVSNRLMASHALLDSDNWAVKMLNFRPQALFWC